MRFCFLIKSLKGTFSQHFPISSDHTLHKLLCFFFTITWARESFRQHNVGGCPYVSVHSICVGCLPGSALLWIGPWKAQAPRMQSDRCRQTSGRLVANCLQTSTKTVFRKEHLKMTARAMWVPNMRASVHFPGLWPAITLFTSHIVSQVLWMNKQYCVGRGMLH